MHLLQKLKDELSSKDLLPKLTPAMFETKVRGSIPKDIPTDQQLLCNLAELFRFRTVLEYHYEENLVLENIYRKQCLAMKRENIEIEFVNFFTGNPHISNLRDWPGSTQAFRLSAYEISPILTENFNFTSVSCFKSMLLSTGLEEFKAVTEYQVTNKHLLIIAVQLNQHACDKWERQIAEIEIARSMNYVVKKTRVLWPSILGRKGEGLIEEKAENEIRSIRARIYSSGTDQFFDFKKIKVSYRDNMRENYIRIIAKYYSVLGEKSPYHEIVSRHLLALLVNGYCREILREIYVQSIKIHIIKTTQQLKRLIRIVPSDLYKQYFHSFEMFDNDKNIVNITSIPTIEYILSMPGVQPQDN